MSWTRVCIEGRRHSYNSGISNPTPPFARTVYLRVCAGHPVSSHSTWHPLLTSSSHSLVSTPVRRRHSTLHCFERVDFATVINDCFNPRSAYRGVGVNLPPRWLLRHNCFPLKDRHMLFSDFVCIWQPRKMTYATR